MKKEDSYFGYIKYSGELVEDGFLDIKKSADALFGIDEMFKFFLLQENNNLGEIDFEIPVRIKKGSWELVFGLSTIIPFVKYLNSIVSKAGKDGFLETGPVKDAEKIFKGTIKTIQWVVKIASHLGTFSVKKFESPKFSKDNSEVGIINKDGEYLYVPKKYLEIFQKCPEKIFSKNAKIIEKNRIFEIGVFDNGIEEKVFISNEEKNIFYNEKDDEDVLFPELKHGDSVELEGCITRLNEKYSTLGFEYKKHIITSKPFQGNISDYKDKIVSSDNFHILPDRVKMIGVIDRTSKKGDFKEKRPMIIFSEIIILEKNKEEQLKIF